MSKEKQIENMEETINAFFDGKCGEHSCWFGFEGDLNSCRTCLVNYLLEQGYRKQSDTVRKMQEALEQRIHSKLSYHGWYLKETVIAEVAKEMLEE
jgi:hypothetical protein